MVLRVKIEVSTRTKKWNFPKGLVHGFCPKIAFFFHKNYVRKDRFRYFGKKKQLFLDQKIEVLTRAKKWTFFKGVSPWILSKNRTLS